MKAPSTNGPNGGRDNHGRFVPGCAGGPGNPLAARVAKLRAAALAAVTASDVRAILRKLVNLAKGGDVQAAKEVLQRTLGPCEAADALQELAELRAAVNDLLEQRGLPCGKT